MNVIKTKAANIVRQRYNSLNSPLDENILLKGLPKWSPYECSYAMLELLTVLL